VDFMAHHEQLKHCAGTPQSAFLKDMCYYLHNYSHILDLDNLMFVRMFLKPYGLGNDRFSGWVRAGGVLCVGIRVYRRRTRVVIPCVCQDGYRKVT
jgi:hypothetical protein